MTGETEQERQERHRQRGLFDRVADLYDSCRQGYPDEIVEFTVDTSNLHTGSAVLEVGCGTGQLTQSLSTRGFGYTAIDIRPP